MLLLHQLMQQVQPQLHNRTKLHKKVFALFLESLMTKLSENKPAMGCHLNTRNFKVLNTILLQIRISFNKNVFEHCFHDLTNFISKQNKYSINQLIKQNTSNFQKQSIKNNQINNKKLKNLLDQNGLTKNLKCNSRLGFLKRG